MSGINLKLNKSDDEQISRLEILKKKNTKLNEELLLKSAEQKRLQGELVSLEEECVKLFGTKSLDDLRNILIQKRQENLLLLEQYEELIITIENDYNNLSREIN